MRVHNILFGGRLAPVYNGIVATQPDKVIFIYSAESRQAVEAVKKGIGLATNIKFRRLRYRLRMVPRNHQ